MSTHIDRVVASKPPPPAPHDELGPGSYPAVDAATLVDEDVVGEVKMEPPGDFDEPALEDDQLDAEIGWLEQEIQKARDAISFEKGRLGGLEPRFKRAKKRQEDMLNFSNVSAEAPKRRGRGM